VKDMRDWAAVQRLHDKGVSIRSIARQMKMSRNTVRKLLVLKEEPKYKRSSYPCKISQYKDQIAEWRCKPYEYNGTRIYRELKALGYEGSIGPLYRYLRVLDEDIAQISSKATVRIETPVGDQAQFDWSPYEMNINGQLKTVYCFSLILAASRKKAICFSLKDDADAIYEAIQDLYAKLGGITLELLIDNPKALVIEHEPKNEEDIRYNPYALLLAKHLGTELNACPCYWPRKKGKIEKPFQYIEEQFVKGKRYESMEQLNQKGDEFIEEWNNDANTTTQRIPNEFYETEEKAALLPLPKTKLRFGEPFTRIVSNDSLVSFKASKYSIPVKYACKKVKVRFIYGYKIEIYDNKSDDLIKTYEHQLSKGTIIRDDKDYEAIAKRVSTSIPQIRRDFTAMFENGERYLAVAERKLEQPCRHARKIMELCDLYTTETIDKFIAYAVDNDCMDITSFKKMIKEKSSEIILSSQDKDKVSSDSVTDNTGIVRSCDYYDEIGGNSIAS